MKKGYVLIAAVIVSVFLVACNAQKGIEKVDYDAVEKLFDGGSGYLLIYLDDDNNYLESVNSVAKEKDEQVLLYDPYKEDSENENSEPVYPEENVEGNYLYRIDKGEIKREVDVNVHQGTELMNELELLFND